MNEPLLLLPGTMCDARLFASQIGEFSVDYPVMVPPLTGRSTFAELSEDILAHTSPRFALGADVFTVQSRALQQRPDQRDTLRAIDVPTLILAVKMMLFAHSKGTR
jgi:hypothetical protein